MGYNTIHETTHSTKHTKIRQKRLHHWVSRDG